MGRLPNLLSKGTIQKPALKKEFINTYIKFQPHKTKISWIYYHHFMRKVKLDSQESQSKT